MRALILLLASCATGASPMTAAPSGSPPVPTPPPGSPPATATATTTATPPAAPAIPAAPTCRIDIDGRQRVWVDGWETGLATPHGAHISTFAAGGRLLFAWATEGADPRGSHTLYRAT